MPKIARPLRPAFATTIASFHHKRDIKIITLVPDGVTAQDVYNILVNNNMTADEQDNGWLFDNGRYMPPKEAAEFLAKHGYIDKVLSYVGPETYPGEWKP